jgi:hypothetical protein
VTRSQFFERYAARSGLSVEELQQKGGVALVCRCDSDGCPGWRVAMLPHLVWLAEHGVLDSITCPLETQEDADLLRSLLPEQFWKSVPTPRQKDNDP